jgi:hypothetical protein
MKYFSECTYGTRLSRATYCLSGPLIKIADLRFQYVSTEEYKVDGNLMVKGTREGPLVICDQR